MAEFKSAFEDAVSSSVENLSGDWGGTRNGTDIPGGQKGTKGIMPEVTTVELNGGGGGGDKTTGITTPSKSGR